MVTTTVAPFRKVESLMAMAGVVFALAGAMALGALLASDDEHGVGNWHFLWLAPLFSLAVLLPAIVGASLMPYRSWTGGALAMGTALVLVLGAASASGGVGLPLGLVYLPAIILLWRGGARAIARGGSQEMVPSVRPYLVWAAGALAPILAFLLLASRWYETCTAIAGSGTLECHRDSLGAEPMTFGLIAAAIGLLAGAGLALLALGHRSALLPLAAVALGLWGVWSPLPRIGLIALALVLISVALLFLPTPSKEETA